MDKIKLFLKRNLLLYHLFQRLYYALRRIMETHILGTKVQEWIWKTKRIKSNIDSLNHSHRQLLVKNIFSFASFKNVLEVGCGSGANLYLLAEKFPEAKLYGIDINSHFIKKGKKWLTKNNINNVKLSVGRADKLKQFDDKSIDVIFTDATLMYIGLDKIGKVIREMKRIVRKVLIFNEWHWENNSQKTKYLWLDGHWIYDYRVLLAKYFSFDNIKISQLPKNLWDDENWRKFGSIMEVKV